MKRLIFVIAITIASFSLSWTTARAQSPAKVTDDFYAKLAELKVRGLPDDTQLAALAPLLSPQIVRRIKNDQKKQADFAKRHPEEKPPWIEGDLFSSLYEGPTGHTVGKTRTAGSARHVDVKLVYAAGGEASKWTDTVVLRQFGRSWRITDILFKGKWQFKAGSSLSKVLR